MVRFSEIYLTEAKPEKKIPVTLVKVASWLVNWHKTSLHLPQVD